MKKIKSILNKSLLFLCIVLVFSCNPDCDTLSRVDATIEPKFDLPQDSYLITFSIPNFLDNRDLFTDRVTGQELTVNETTKINAESFENGYLIRASDIEDRRFNFYVVDTDCGGFIPINSTFLCEPLASLRAEVLPKVRRPGEEILVKTTPSNLLKERDIFVRNASNEAVMISSKFSEELGGRIAVMPANIVGEFDLFLKDEGCNQFTPLNGAIRIADEDFVQNNASLFVTPTPPNIIIPPINIPAPTNVVNTWFSPDNRSYCIWFFPELKKIELSGIPVCWEEQNNLLPGNHDVGPPDFASLNFDDLDRLDFSKVGSWELKVGACADELDPNNALYTANPVQGVINKETGSVSIAIDRTQKGLPIERYEGSIVKAEDLPAYANTSGVCAEDGGTPDAVMLLTSQETGKQLILFRQAVVGVPERLLCQ